MSNELGKSITRAARFMMQIRQDVLSMLASLDTSFAQHGWNGARTSKLSSQHPISHVFRLYLPREGNNRNRMIGVVVELEAPEPIDEAVVLIIAADFPQDVDDGDVWNNWYRSSCQDVIRAIGVTSAAVVMPREQLNAKQFMAAATAGAAMIIPLVSLTNADRLHLDVVEPALRAVAGL